MNLTWFAKSGAAGIATALWFGLQALVFSSRTSSESCLHIAGCGIDKMIIFSWLVMTSWALQKLYLYAARQHFAGGDSEFLLLSTQLPSTESNLIEPLRWTSRPPINHYGAWVAGSAMALLVSMFSSNGNACYLSGAALLTAVLVTMFKNHTMEISSSGRISRDGNQLAMVDQIVAVVVNEEHHQIRLLSNDGILIPCFDYFRNRDRSSYRDGQLAAAARALTLQTGKNIAASLSRPIVSGRGSYSVEKSKESDGWALKGGKIPALDACFTIMTALVLFTLVIVVLDLVLIVTVSRSLGFG